MTSRFNRRKRFSTPEQLPEICLTPLIDTALTLLVIFMVTTPMIQNSIKIDLPHGATNTGGNTAQPKEIMIDLDKNEQIYVNSMPTALPHLKASIEQQLTQLTTPKKRVWISVDRSKTCSADAFIKIMDVIYGLKGIDDVAILTKKPTSAT